MGAYGLVKYQSLGQGTFQKNKYYRAVHSHIMELKAGKTLLKNMPCGRQMLCSRSLPVVPSWRLARVGPCTASIGFRISGVTVDFALAPSNLISFGKATPKALISQLQIFNENPEA